MTAQSGIKPGPAPALATMRRSPIERWLPPVSVALFAIGILTILAVAGSTLGYDFQAYVGGAHRLLEGAPLYDQAVDVAGPFAIYLYPPPFALAMAPFAWLPASIAV